MGESGRDLVDVMSNHHSCWRGRVGSEAGQEGNQVFSTAKVEAGSWFIQQQ